MTPIALLVAGRLDAPTGGSIYNRRLAESLTARGCRVVVHELAGEFPQPDRLALTHAAEVLAARSPRDTIVVDGLAFGAMPDVVRAVAARRRLVALVHLPLAAEIGLVPAAAARLRESEQRALAAAAVVVVTGQAGLSLMAEHGLAHPRIAVVEPGTDPAPLAAGSNRDGEVQLLSVASVTPGKGYDVLFDALATLHDERWHLTAVGSLTRAPQHAASIQAALARHGLRDRVTFTGALSVPEAAGRYHHSDLFVHASRRETYGMAVAEALARGLPVVATATGAAPALLADDAGVVVPVGDAAALADALRTMVSDERRRARHAAGARRVRERLRTWEDAAAEFLAAIDDGHDHG